MLKLTYAGCLGLSPAISSQFTVKMCAAAKIEKKIQQNPSFGGWKSFKSSMLTNLQSPSPVFVMICSKSVLTCNRFYAIKANSGKIAFFRGGTLLWRPGLRGTPHPRARSFVTINYSPWSSPQWRSRDPSLRRFDTIPQCDRRTETRQTTFYNFT